jgi:hypothetical protein
MRRDEINLYCTIDKETTVSVRRIIPLIINKGTIDSTTVETADIETYVITKDNRVLTALWNVYGKCSVSVSSALPLRILNL